MAVPERLPARPRVPSSVDILEYVPKVARTLSPFGLTPADQECPSPSRGEGCGTGRREELVRGRDPDRVEGRGEIPGRKPRKGLDINLLTGVRELKDVRSRNECCDFTRPKCLNPSTGSINLLSGLSQDPAHTSTRTGVRFKSLNLKGDGTEGTWVSKPSVETG